MSTTGKPSHEERPLAALIINPASGRVTGKRVRYAEERLRAGSFEVRTFDTSESGDATLFAMEAAREGAAMVIAAGGDGTINETINGLAGTDVPLAILPMGTTNVLARELGIPLRTASAIGIALGRRPRRVSLGKVDAAGASRYFSLMAGVGFDAEAVHNVNRGIKRISGRLAYVLGGLRTLASWRPGPINVTVGDREFECHSLIASNSRKYAGDFDLAPGADISDPFLHLFLITGGSRTDIARFAAGLLARRHARMKGVICLKARGLEIAGSARIQVDGEYMAETPASITIEPSALGIIY